MVHASSALRHHESRLNVDHHVHEYEQQRRLHNRRREDPRRYQGRRCSTAETGVASLLQHHHSTGDNRWSWLRSAGAEHPDLRWHLLSEGSRQEARSDGLHPDQWPRVNSNDNEEFHDDKVGKRQAHHAGAAAVLHDPRAKPVDSAATRPIAPVQSTAAAGQQADRAADQQHH